MNLIVIMGRLTRDPELKTTQSGMEYCKFSVAVDRYQGKNAEKATDYFNCTAWGANAAFINKYFSKGRGITVTGSMQNHPFEDSETGKKRDSWELRVDRAEFVPSDSKGGNNGSAQTFSAVPDDGDLPF